MVEFRPLVGDVSGRELCLDLREPDEWVSGPEGWYLDRYRDDRGWDRLQRVFC